MAPRLSLAAATLALACPLGAETGGITTSALAPRSAAEGTTLFTSLPPERTGITAPNLYDDPVMWRERYREFSLGAIGTGIAIGDYDADGLPDVYVVRKIAGNRLFRNLGGFRFEDVTDNAGVAGPAGPWKQGAAFADVNNDGRLDLYVCRYDAPNLLFINQGSGRFTEEAAARGVAVKDSSGQAYFADFNRDGWVDFFLQTNVLDSEASPEGQRDRLYLNRGDGSFHDATESAGLFGHAQGHSATCWDYNEDGWPDVYVANDFKEADQLYRNNGDGTFTNVLSWVVAHTPHSSMGADLGDVNNDGRIDLLVADMATRSRVKDHRGMAKLRVGLPESDSRPNAAPQYMRNALFLNAGGGRTLEAAFLTGLDATDWTWSVRFEDLDNDGWNDVFFTNGTVREFHNADLVNKMIAIESISGRTGPMKESPEFREQNLAFRNLGDLRFVDVSREWGLDLMGISFGAAFGDLDGDGDLDLVHANYNAEVSVLRNDAPDGNRVIFELRGSASNTFALGASLHLETARGVQTRTLVSGRGYLSSSEPILHFGLGEETQILRATVRWPSGRTQVLENLDANRRYRLHEPEATVPPPSAPGPADQPPVGRFVDVTQVRGLNLLFREPSVNEFARQRLLPIRLNRQGPAAAVADLDGDGEEDVLVGGATGESGRFLFNGGDGSYLPFGSSIFSGATQAADAGMLLFDADGDGDTDLFAAKGGNGREAGHAAYQVRLFLNDGTGRFDASPAEAVANLRVSASAVVAADYNRDARLDVFVAGRLVPGAYPSTPHSALLENRAGTLVDVTEERAPGLKSAGLVTSALWSDANGDGWPDLLLTLEWGTVRCFINEGGERLVDHSARLGFTAAGAGWWTSLTGADLNGDGQIDYLAGNAGLNTRYRASPEEPALLYTGTFDAGNRPQLIEAHWNGGTLYPVRSLLTFQGALPAVARNFPTYDAYSKASLETVFGRDRLDAAVRLEATEFQTGLFLSQPDGTFVFRPLPRLAQTAPAYGMVTGDFDGDGRTDVCLVQNSHAPIPEVGRFDGGLGWFLRGDGKGGLSPVPHAESGFVVKGDAKALVNLDYNRDGWPDLFLTRNNGRSLALQNTPTEGFHAFAVRLHGKPGNPSCVGARIGVTLADGTTQTQEVYAGSGYLSQTSAAVFFGYPTAHPPVSLTVRWPDGSESSFPWTNATARIDLRQPSAN